MYDFLETKLNISIIDDHRIYRETLARVLSKMFCLERVEVFASGMEFIQSLSGGTQQDLAIIDMGIPVMDGIETTIKALEIQPDLKILAISSEVDIIRIQKIIEGGAHGFLAKGGDRSGLKDAILSILNDREFTPAPGGYLIRY